MRLVVCKNPTAEEYTRRTDKSVAPLVSCIFVAASPNTREKPIAANCRNRRTMQWDCAGSHRQPRSGVQVPTGIITRGYRLHGVTSFPIRRAELHAWSESFLSIAHQLSVLTPAFEAFQTSGKGNSLDRVR